MYLSTKTPPKSGFKKITKKTIKKLVFPNKNDYLSGLDLV